MLLSTSSNYKTLPVAVGLRLHPALTDPYAAGVVTKLRAIDEPKLSGVSTNITFWNGVRSSIRRLEIKYLAAQFV
jgi:hypothetical protein